MASSIHRQLPTWNPTESNLPTMNRNPNHNGCRPTLAQVVTCFAVCCIGLSAGAQPPKGFPPAPVEVAEVTQSNVAAGQTFVGTVMATRVSHVGSAVDGRIIEFPVNEGDRVQEGDMLARLRTGTIEIEVAAAKAERDLRRHELDELRNGSRREEIDQATARMRATKARSDHAQARLRRALSLMQSKTVAQEDFDAAESAAEEALQLFAESQAISKLAVAGPRLEKIAQAEARLDVAEEQVRLMEDRQEKYIVRAPFDGYVVTERTEVGQWVKQGELIAEVVELDQVDIHVHVLEDYVAHLKYDADCRVEIGALPDKAVTGKVVQIVPRADMRSRTFPVKVRVPNERRGNDVLLKAGLFARVTLPVGKPEQGLLVPKDALVLGGREPLVYVVDPGTKENQEATVRPVPVELGVAAGNRIQVRGELKRGQQVVIRGNERLRPGQSVKVVLPAAAPAATPEKKS